MFFTLFLLFFLLILTLKELKYCDKRFRLQTQYLAIYSFQIGYFWRFQETFCATLYLALSTPRSKEAFRIGTIFAKFINKDSKVGEDDFLVIAADVSGAWFLALL